MNSKSTPKGHIPATVRLFLFVAICACIGLIGRFTWVSKVAAQAGGMQVTLQFTTAAQAALGAPMGYQETSTNTGSTSIVANTFVDMIAPDGTVFNLFSNLGRSYAAGASGVVNKTFTSSTFTSQLGSTFTLHGYITNSSGAVLSSQSLPFTIVAVPAGGVYASIGGVGPDPALIGMKYGFQTVTANLGTSSQTLTTKVTLVYPDSTNVTVNGGGFKSTIAAGGNVITPTNVTSSQYTTQTGSFSVRVDVLNGNAIVATQTVNFTRNPLPANYYPPAFTDSTAAAGVGVMNMAGMPCPAGSTVPMMMGQGAAVADYDGDGREDIFVTDGMMAGHLWHNNGVDANGKFLGFTDMAATAGIPVVMNAVAANFFDYDNDGHPDLLILTNDGMNRLFHNNGNGTFTDVSMTVGVALQGINTMNTSATMGDYDGDGYLDVYVAVHGDCNGNNTQDHLYHNNQGAGFTDVSSLLNNIGSQLLARGLTAVFADFNGDGRPDIYVGNDIGTKFGPDVMWRNAGPNGLGGWSNFIDVSKATGTGLAVSAMGIAVGDFNRDGIPDIYLTNQAANVLLQGTAKGTWTQVQNSANAGRGSFPSMGSTFSNIGWGVGFYDLNNNGWEDIFFGGGSLTMGLSTPNGLLVNNQDGTFLDLTLPQGVTGPGMMTARTVVFGDFNKDGYVDIFETAMMGMPTLYMNNGKATGNPNHYLRVQLIGNPSGTPPSNRDAVGAKLVASVGGATLVRYITNGGTFEGNSDLIAHFGLGASMQMDTLTITWPSGKTTTLTTVPADQLLTVTEP